MTHIEEIMEKQIVGVRWEAPDGAKNIDSTTLAKLPEVLGEIEKESGKVLGVRLLERID